MRVIFVLVLILISACSTTQEVEPKNQIDHAKYNARYNELITVIKRAATLGNFKELRDVYVLTSHYHPYGSPERSFSKAMFEGIGSKNWKACLENTHKILKFNYISLNAHYGAMVCSYESDNEKQGEYHKYVLNGLLDAIWATGDGKSKETAFFSTSTLELQAFINLHGLETVDQALVRDEGKIYDLMGVRDPKKDEEFKWYFDISAQWALGFKSIK